MATSKKDAIKKVSDIRFLENYLALYLCIKGVIEVPDGMRCEEITKEMAKTLPRKEINSADALKLMGIKIEKNMGDF